MQLAEIHQDGLVTLKNVIDWKYILCIVKYQKDEIHEI